MKFNNYQEMYAAVRAWHGKINEEDCKEFLEEIYQADEFGTWSWDCYQCGPGSLFCYEYSHTNSVDGKTHVFYFRTDGTDTIDSEDTFDTEEEALESTIDYDFLNTIAAMSNKDPIK
jgi:hypothetical protein